MNVLALFHEKLPTPLRQLGEREREAFEAGISPFLSPLNHLATVIKCFAEDLRDENKGLYLKLVSTILGLKRLNLPPAVEQRFIPVLADYISERGTRRSLEIMTQSILGTQDFIIEERGHPYKALYLGEVPVEQRLTDEDQETVSLTIHFNQGKHTFCDSDLRAYRNLLAQELPPEMDVYLIFKSDQERPVVPRYCAIIGEPLL